MRQQTAVQPIIISSVSWHFRLYNQWLARQRDDWNWQEYKQADHRCQYAKIVMREALYQWFLRFFFKPIGKVGIFPVFQWTLCMVAFGLATFIIDPIRAAGVGLILSAPYTIPVLNWINRRWADPVETFIAGMLLIIGLIVVGLSVYITKDPFTELVRVSIPMFLGFLAVIFVGSGLVRLYRASQQNKVQKVVDEKGTSFRAIVWATLQGMWLHVCPPIVLPQSALATNANPDTEE